MKPCRSSGDVRKIQAGRSWRRCCVFDLEDHGLGLRQGVGFIMQGLGFLGLDLGFALVSQLGFAVGSS